MVDSTQFQKRLCSNVQVTILNGQTVSSAGFLNGTSLVAIDIPAGFDGAALTFQVSSDEGATFLTYARMIDGTDVSAVVTAGKSFATDPNDFVGYNAIKLVSDIPQVGDIPITLKTIPIN